MPASPPARRELTIQRLIWSGGGELLKTHPHLAWYKQAALKQFAACRTGALGSHLWSCAECGYLEQRPNSCRHRHCPTCSGPRKAQWLTKLLARLLPTDHMQVVFTLPHELIPVIQRYPDELYELLFHASWQTLQQLAADPQHLGATLGAVAVLHTWNQELQAHPHVHFVLPAGGVSLDGERWVPCHRGKRKDGQPGQYYLFPHKVISKLFRGKFLAGLEQLILSGQIPLAGLSPGWNTRAKIKQRLSEVYRKKWVVYQQSPPVGSERDMLAKYLARYVSGSAISDARLVRRDGEQIVYTVKNRQTGGREERSLPLSEFLSRYLLHVLPPGLTRVRYYGWMCSPCVKKREHAQSLCATWRASQPDAPAPAPSPAPVAPSELASEKPLCPHCQRGPLELQELFREKTWKVRRRSLVTGPLLKFRDGPVVTIPPRNLFSPGVSSSVQGPPSAGPPSADRPSPDPPSVAPRSVSPPRVVFPAEPSPSGETGVGPGLPERPLGGLFGWRSPPVGESPR